MYLPSRIYSLEPLVALGQARKAELAIFRGDAKSGVESLRVALEKNSMQCVTNSLRQNSTSPLPKDLERWDGSPKPSR